MDRKIGQIYNLKQYDLHEKKGPDQRPQMFTSMYTYSTCWTFIKTQGRLNKQIKHGWIYKTAEV